MLTKALAILAISSSWALAQPQADHRPQQERRRAMDQQSDQASPQNAEALRKRLAQTLEFAKRIVEKHEEALAQLNAGDDPRDVMRSLRTPEIQQTMRNAKRSQQRGQSDPAVHDQTPPPQPFSKQDIQLVRTFITEHLHDIDARLKHIESLSSPQATDRLVGQLAPKILEILNLKESNPAMSSLKFDELKAGLLYVDASRKYRILLRAGSPNQTDIDQAKQAVENAASARFDAQVQIKQYEIHQLSTRIEQLHQALEELNSQRDDQVQAQVQSAGRSPSQRFNRQPPRRPQSERSQHTKPADD